MNPYEMVVLIVAIVMIAGVLKTRLSGRRSGNGHDRADEAENARLREEVSQLKDRVKVLERITVEKENSLSKQIEELRDR